MYPISSSCSVTPAWWDHAAIRRSYSAVQLSRISVSSCESKDISIYTDEGDKVTISYDHQTQASYANLKALAYRGDFAAGENQVVAKGVLARIQGESFQFEDSRNLIISVDGNLNEQELADIKKAIEGIDKIMTDLLKGGNFSEAMADATELRDLDSIAGLEADYHYEKAVLVENMALREAGIYSRYGLSENISSAGHRRNADPFKKIVDGMTKIVEDSHAKPSNFYKPVKMLFANIIQELKEDKPGNRATRHVAELIGAELIKKIRQKHWISDFETVS